MKKTYDSFILGKTDTFAILKDSMGGQIGNVISPDFFDKKINETGGRYVDITVDEIDQFEYLRGKVDALIETIGQLI